MVSATYKNGQWGASKIVSVEDFQLAPTAKVLHYAQEIFEGLKAFKMADGSVAVFRPRDNIARMSRSAEIMSMPAYPEDDFLNSMRELIKKCRHLVPNGPGALYLRPTTIATESTLGVAPASEYAFFILASPVGGYFGDAQSDTPASVSVWVTRDYVRAVRSGVGAAKTGANYAASMSAVQKSKKLGFQNVLFLDAINQENLEELSGMNVFIVENGVLKTPALNDTILDGVTRKSLLRLSRDRNIPTEETQIPLTRLLAGLRSGAVTEMFACGTGASVTAISELGWNNERIAVRDRTAGPITTQLYRALLAIQTGTEKPPEPEWIVTC